MELNLRRIFGYSIGRVRENFRPGPFLLREGKFFQRTFLAKRENRLVWAKKGRCLIRAICQNQVYDEKGGMK
jgi:hypothetical protein